MGIETSLSRRRFLAASAAVMAAGSEIAAKAFAAAATQPGGSGDRPPNILYILCDDLGYGDVHYFNPTRCKIPTPCIDRLASQGVAFTDAHADSSLCSPSRYGILTGRYSWRSRLQSNVLLGYDPPLIPPTRLTVAKMLENQGYYTACVGKWHVGLDWAKADPSKPVGVSPGSFRGLREGSILDREAQQKLDNVDYRKPIVGGPTALGFDYFYGITGALDMGPHVMIENDRALGEPTKLFGKKGLSLAMADYDPHKVLPDIVDKSKTVIRDHFKAADPPAFLYFALTSPHAPIVPTRDWLGKSGLGPYGDYVMETDWAVGQVLDALEASGQAENTLVIFTSDNGCSPWVVESEKLETKGHFASGPYRGYKTDIWEGGSRIPFIARWPGKIAPGAHCDQLMCLNDFVATAAALTGATLPGNAGEDSVNMLPALLGQAKQPLRQTLIDHSGQGYFAIRKGAWKLELCPGSGGHDAPTVEQALQQGLPPVQLYRLDSDEGEKKNLESSEPGLVRQLVRQIDQTIAAGRSTPGPSAKNDVPVDMWKKTPPLKGATEGD